MPADAQTGTQHGGVIPEFDLTDRMRKALRHRGQTAVGIAEYLGVTRDAVGKWLNGSRRPSAQTLRLWAIYTGVDYDWLKDGASQ